MMREHSQPHMTLVNIARNESEPKELQTPIVPMETMLHAVKPVFFEELEKKVVICGMGRRPRTQATRKPLSGQQTARSKHSSHAVAKGEV